MKRPRRRLAAMLALVLLLGGLGRAGTPASAAATQAAAAPAAATAVDLAAGRPATADSSQGGHSPAAGADGAASTRWCAADGNTGHWWQVDLGVTADLTGTQVTWEFSGTYQYRVEISTDAAAWTTAADRTGTTDTAQDRTDTFTGRARFVRVTVTGLPAGKWASFVELRVLGFLPAGPVPVTIDVDAAAGGRPYQPVYRFFGADEPNYAYLPDGQTLLGDIGALGHQTYFRAHNLMTTGDGTPALKWGSTNMYTEDAAGNPIYNWTIVDRIFDTYLSKGVKPYVEIGFMPTALSTHPDPYQHHWKPGDPYDDIFTGWAYPPKDYNKWRELVYQWAEHSVQRYGRAEVEQWYWQVWNESNAGYWKGTAAEFYKLNDYALDGLRRALPNARIGGADTAGPGGQFQRDFLKHTLSGTDAATGAISRPLDFVSFHAKGAPAIVNGNVRMGIASQLRNVRDGFEIVASYPEYKPKPIVIGEADPDGCAACGAADYPENAYRNTTLYAGYTAASIAREYQLADRFGVNLQGALNWSFEFEDQPIFAGFRVMSTEGGINLPVFNTMRMMGRMSGERLSVTSSSEVPLDTMLATGARGAQPDVSAIATADARRLAVMSWNYHDDDVAGPDAAISMRLHDLPPGTAGGMHLTEFRIDDEHSNAYTAWQRMGSPVTPTTSQIAELRAAGQLQTIGEPSTVPVADGRATVSLRLPRQGVSLLLLTW